MREYQTQSACERMALAILSRRNECSGYFLRKLALVVVICAVATANFRRSDAFPVVASGASSQSISARISGRMAQNDPGPSRSLAFKTALSAQLSQQEASKGIDKVVAALRKDKSANDELGRLERVTAVLGYGTPKPGTAALRFNASFKRSGFGRSSIPMAFGLGQTNTPEGRGTMVGQVKATVDIETGKVTSCSVFRDLGYGRSFNLKI
jgi:hypothetical protein